MTSAPLYLLGASGLARETAEAARAAGREVRGVLDDDPARHGTRCGGVEVLGPIDLAAGLDGDLVACVGAGSGRRSVVERLSVGGVAAARFATVIHPDVRMPASVRLGQGTVLLAGVVLTADVTVGDHVVVMPAAVLTHDCRLEDYATLAAGVLLGGSVHVGEAAYLGMGAAVHPGRTVGAGAVVGMAATVLSDIPPGQTWVGTPARDLRDRT